MDPVTHIASGILAGQAVRDRFPRTWRLIVFTAFCAWIPDIDLVFGNLGPVASLRYHRGPTHSILGGAVMAAVLALAFRPLIGERSLGRVFVLAYGCILLHDFQDVITTYGTQILWPLSDARIGLPAVFIVDPIYTGVMLLAVILGFVMKSRARTVALAALCWIFLYPATSLGLREIVTAAQDRRLAAEGMPQAVAHVTTDGLSPIFWKVVVDDGENYRLRGASLFAPSGGPDIVVRTKADRGEMRRLGDIAPVVATYDWFAEFPAVAELPGVAVAPPGAASGGGLVPAAQAGQAADGVSPSRVLLYSDMRFLGTSPALPEARRDPKRMGFAMRVALDEAGRPLFVDYYRGDGPVRVFSSPSGR